MTLRISIRPFARLLALAVVCLLWSQAAAQVEPSQSSNRAGDAGSRQRLPAQDLPELKCQLYKRSPILDFEFRFVAPFRVDIPFWRLVGGGRRLTITPLIRPVSIENAKPVRYRDVYVLPKEVPRGTRGNLELTGSFALGEGDYEIEWRLRDEAGRSCRVSWQVKTKLSRRDRNINMTLNQGEVARSAVYLFRREPLVERGPAQLRVKLLLNLDVPNRRRARVRLMRYVPMISGLRMMSRHPDLAEFEVVAFSVEEQEVLHRGGLSERIDFPALGKAIESLTPATVEFKNLQRGSDLEFLDTLMAEELNDIEGVDALIFVGADDRYGKRVSPETIDQLRKKQIPAFHFNSTLFLWRGAIGNLVRALDGKEYRVRQPHELATAVQKLVAEILEQRPQQPEAAAESANSNRPPRVD